MAQASKKEMYYNTSSKKGVSTWPMAVASVTVPRFTSTPSASWSPFSIATSASTLAASSWPLSLPKWNRG